MPEGEATIFAAGLLLPVTAPAIQDGALLVRDGRIASVGTLAEVGSANPDADVRYFPHYTVIPGAVNAHAHLGFRRKDPPEGGTFSGWLARLIERLPEKEAWTAEAARDSAREAIEAGTTLMAESSPYGECLPQLAESGMAGAVYAEFFPGDYDGAEPGVIVESIIARVTEMNENLPERVHARVSVHAPYTVDPESSRIAARRTREMGWTLAYHLSESAEEIEMLAPETIAAHLATGVGEEEIEVLARAGVAAAHCPRSNENLGCGVSPVPEMMRRGVRVGMGTDGLWSGPSMNLFEETIVAVRLHGFDGATGLRLATLEGARVLGLEHQAGSLEPGKWADFAVVEAEAGGSDAELAVLEAAAGGAVAATIAGGNVIYNRTEDLTCLGGVRH